MRPLVVAVDELVAPVVLPQEQEARHDLPYNSLHLVPREQTSGRLLRRPVAAVRDGMGPAHDQRAGLRGAQARAADRAQLGVREHARGGLASARRGCPGRNAVRRPRTAAGRVGLVLAGSA